MSENRPFVSVILPTYNRCEVTERTIRTYLAQDYPKDRFEILIADNSSDETPDMVRRLSAEEPVPIHLLHNDERLPAVKRNQALRQARGDIVVFANDDVWVNHTFLREHVRAHQRQPGPVAVLGLVEQSPAMPQTPFVQWYQPFAYQQIMGMAHQAVPYHYHWAMNVSLPRRVMLDRNLVFHEDWAEIGHEDVELGFRWTQAGYPIIFEPAARGEHFHPHDLASACRLQESIGRGLRDLEVLVTDPGLLSRYGVLTRSAPLALKLRFRVRLALFNRVTVPFLRRRLDRARQRSRTAEWAYWKIMLYYTQRGYRAAPARNPRPVATRLGGAA